ncbi:hypothetical protein HPP92_016376 [Vanilla planifolia]|uniref:Uncharacterized protein n=1 Tax=Vanilla planifolia TaxID=51239 RepID=A0A835QEP7_VANPL|nr:hypothetical protein HPP92_016376 [Vanilla planifolia]
MVPGKKASQGLSKACAIVIVVASVERFAFKGVSSNLVTYLSGSHVKMGAAAAAKFVSSWNGVTSMLPLVTSVLVDSCWDRYSTITSSSLLYIVGLVLLTSWALLDAWMPIYTLFFPLCLISIGLGGYNPSLQAFGADQLGLEEDLSCGKEEKNSKKSLFFQWWYFGICTGSFLGNSIMSYIQDNFGWVLGFSIPAAAMAASVVCFSCGSVLYVKKEVKATRWQIESITQSMKAYISKIFNKKISLPSSEDDLIELELQEKSLCEDIDGKKEAELSTSDMHNAESIARVTLKLMPIWVMLLMFAVIFQQPSTFFTNQGMVMNHSLGTRFLIPPAMLQSVITISIITMMPLYDKLMIPFFRFVLRDSKGITVLQRIGIGMLLSIAAMIIAATVETKRIQATKRGDQLSIFWLLPQYILLGISDIFTVVGMQEFFYSQVPKTMRTIGIGLYLSIFGVGSFISALLISLVEMFTTTCERGCSWFSDDMREAKLYNYYWLLALLASASFVIFSFICKYYE